MGLVSKDRGIVPTLVLGVLNVLDMLCDDAVASTV